MSMNSKPSFALNTKNRNFGFPHWEVWMMVTFFLLSLQSYGSMISDSLQLAEREREGKEKKNRKVMPLSQGAV